MNLQIIQNLWPGEASPGIQSPVLIPPVQERPRHNDKSKSESHRDDQRNGEPLLWGKAEIAGTVQTRKEDAEGASLICINI